MMRSRSWFGFLGKPKNIHSLEHLKYLYNVLTKNQVVSESNRSLLVETLRSIAEILIWGDQNDGSIFEFFFEKNMLSFFLKIMNQKCGSYVCVQLLQTLNIMFENIRSETTLYYLLSNNYVNSIIVHKFDFSDEEVMAYYISFLKTLSLKLNTHTIHFFYSEHTNDFPLYTEAIKFFNHPESMVRIAVRTLTLNVYRVHDKSMLEFIRDKTAAPYFSNLVWFIGKHVAELDSCLREQARTQDFVPGAGPVNREVSSLKYDHQRQHKLADLVAEHLDHLHYVSDILNLEISDLNQVLTDHLLNKLFLPLYIGSLSHSTQHVQEGKQRVSKVIALFLLSQVFLITNHGPLVELLTVLLLDRLPTHSQGDGICKEQLEGESDIVRECAAEIPIRDSGSALNASISDEEKSKMLGLTRDDEAGACAESLQPEPSIPSPRHRRLSTRPCLHSILHGLDVSDSDYSSLFSLCLLYSIRNNAAVGEERLSGILSPTDSANDYNAAFVEKLVRIICQSCSADSKIRLVTLELTIKLLRSLSTVGENLVLSDCHLAAISGAKEEITSLLRGYYKSEELFLDLFEDEFNEQTKKPLNVEFLMMDAALLLPPTSTPMTGIDFVKRLPCGDVERVRRGIRVFFLVRDLCISLGLEHETVKLPLTNPQAWVQVDNVLDLNNSDLIACTIVAKDGTKIRRFLVMDVLQLILVEPDTRRLGWGVAKLVGFLQDVEVTGDKEDSRSLHITIHRPLSSNATVREPLLSARFILDDHIRCMAARQRLTKGRVKARQKKMHQIAKLLDLPSNIQLSASPSQGLRSRAGSGGRPSRDLRPLLPLGGRTLHTLSYTRRDSAPDNSDSSDAERRRSRENSRPRRRPDGSASPNRRSGPGSPRMPRPRSEEIPLEDIRRNGRRNILLSGAEQTRFQTSPLTTLLGSPSTPIPSVVPLELPIEPVETSFTEDNHPSGSSTPGLVGPDSSLDDGDKRRRQKGQVETV